MFDAELFFSLEWFAHRILWKKGKPVWEPLHCLMEYLRSLSHRIEVEIPEGVYLVNREMVSIGEGTVLEPGVCIRGPCVIGKNCRVSHGAYLREGVLCGDRCAIGHSAELKHSILLNDAHATHFTYVGDSILGNGVNLGAGVKCANLRLDKREIAVSFEEKKIETGLQKMGAVVGDGSQIGCNCVLNPGTLIGKGCFLRPLTNGSGVILPKNEAMVDGNRAISREN